jgi:hydroxyethylthiazole kinase-like uncharacterized protein yjeF
MNLETALLDVRQMGEADRLAVAAGIPAVELMENAGRAVAREIQQRWSARPITVLCGPGNNGGDGFVVARLLAEAGWPVRLALPGPRDRLTGEARHHAQRWSGAVESLTPAVLHRAALVVDALFGAGLSRALTGPAAETLSVAANRGLPVVAIDVPSGLLGDTGESLGAVAAVLTVTFFRKKPGHLLLPGRHLCGELVVADIGIPAAVLDQIVPETFENDPRLWRSALPLPSERAGEIPAFPADSESPFWKIVGTSLLVPSPDEHPLFDPIGDPLTRTRSAARRTGAVIVLKGSDTLIAAPDGRAIINPGFQNRAEKSASEPDSVILRGLLAQGMDPFLAAAAAVWPSGTTA